MFPDTMSQIPGSYVGLVLSSELPAADRELFEDLLKQMSDLRIQVHFWAAYFKLIKRGVNNQYILPLTVSCVKLQSSVCCLVSSPERNKVAKIKQPSSETVGLVRWEERTFLILNCKPREEMETIFYIFSIFSRR